MTTLETLGAALLSLAALAGAASGLAALFVRSTFDDELDKLMRAGGEDQ